MPEFLSDEDAETLFPGITGGGGHIDAYQPGESIGWCVVAARYYCATDIMLVGGLSGLFDGDIATVDIMSDSGEHIGVPVLGQQPGWYGSVGYIADATSYGSEYYALTFRDGDGDIVCYMPAPSQPWHGGPWILTEDHCVGGGGGGGDVDGLYNFNLYHAEHPLPASCVDADDPLWQERLIVNANAGSGYLVDTGNFGGLHLVGSDGSFDMWHVGDPAIEWIQVGAGNVIAAMPADFASGLGIGLVTEVHVLGLDLMPYGHPGDPYNGLGYDVRAAIAGSNGSGGIRVEFDSSLSAPMGSIALVMCDPGPNLSRVVIYDPSGPDAGLNPPWVSGVEWSVDAIELSFAGSEFDDIRAIVDNFDPDNQLFAVGWHQFLTFP